MSEPQAAIPAQSPMSFALGAATNADGITILVSQMHSYQESDVAAGGYVGANVVVLELTVNNGTQSLYNPAATDITVTDTTIGQSADQVVDASSSAPDIGFESQVAPNASEVITTGWAVDAHDALRVDVQFSDPNGDNLTGTWAGVAA